MPFSEVKSVYEQCDIGVDQILYGWYGKVSIELMALGKPVACYIDQQWFPCRDDMPIVNADPRNLTMRLKELVENCQLRHELGKKGQEFVKKHHDVIVIIDQCLSIYEDSL